MADERIVPASPSAPGPSEPPLSGEEQLAIQRGLLALWKKQASLYTGGNHSSLPAETAQRLLDSICFTLCIAPDDPAPALRRLLQSDLETQYRRGLCALRRQAESGKALWQAACLNLPEVENIALTDTLQDIGRFLRRYDLRFFAHEIPCSIDYQLARSVPETLLGIRYVNEYLLRLLTENQFLRKFDPCLVRRLLSCSCPDYRGLLVNLFEPAAANALGRQLLHLSPLPLGISPAEQGQIAALFRRLSAEESAQVLRHGAERLCSSLDAPQWAPYLTAFALGLLPRIRAALPHGHLEGIFLTLP